MPFQFNMKRSPDAGLPPEGIHRFIVEDANEATSEKGPKIVLRLRIYVNGVKHNSAIFEHLSSSEAARFKVDQFFDAVGAPEEGMAGAAWFKGKSGYARIKHGKNQDGDPQANIARYLSPAAAERALEKEADEGGYDPINSRVAVEPAANPTRKTGGKKAAVAEMDDDASPF